MKISVMVADNLA